LEYEDIGRQFKYYQNDPPTHILVQGFMKSLGVIKDRPKTSDAPSGKTELTDEEFKELTGMFSS
jgi:hypothetical protein